MSATPATPEVENPLKADLNADVAVPRSAEEITAQIHLEYARYLEKRNSVRAQLRKDNGRLRRSQIYSQLAS